MSYTWFAIIASLLMGIGALLLFVFAVKRDYFRNMEEAKYQVFWSDIEELVETAKPTQEDHYDEFGKEPPTHYGG